MKYNREIHHRHSLRLKGFDYISPGFYFITFCTQNRDCLFGDISRGKMTLNQIGDMVKMEWEKLSNRFKNIVLDEYVMMPNHIHGIIQIIGASPFQAVNDHLKNYEKHHNKEFLQNPGGTNENSISRIIQGFKSISTNTYIHSVTKNHWPAFEKYFWQRDFFDRIIRDPEELEQVRNYIINNPQNWESDEDNPINIHNKHTTQTT